MTERPLHLVNSAEIDLEIARALGLEVTADCGAVITPRDVTHDDEGPWCATCFPRRSRRNHGKHRTPIEIRRAFPHYVYRCYDAKDRLLYVGCTYNPPARMRQHRAEKRGWIGRVARTRLTVWPGREKALVMERLAIETESPLFNKAFNRRSA